MSRNKNLILVYAAVALLVALPALAENGGYSGLMAPKKDPAIQQKQQPLGYGGLIPGKTTNSPQQSQIPQALQARPENKIAPPPGGKAYSLNMEAVDLDRPPEQSIPLGPRPVKTTDDIALMAALYAAEDNVDKPDLSLPEDIIKALSKPRPKKEGLSSTEQMTKFQIDQLFIPLDKKTASKDERAKAARAAEEQLTAMQKMFYSQKATPIEIYKKLGLPDVYAQSEKESAENSIEMIEAALENIKKFL